MITFDAFLVFLGAALLPVIYLFIVSRWIEPEFRKTYPTTTRPKSWPASTPVLAEAV
jgi:hypothetical protein